jgi:hypothetical protein
MGCRRRSKAAAKPDAGLVKLNNYSEKLDRVDPRTSQGYLADCNRSWCLKRKLDKALLSRVGPFTFNACATIRAWSMTAIRSATRSASSMECVVKNTVNCSSRHSARMNPRSGCGFGGRARWSARRGLITAVKVRLKIIQINSSSEGPRRSLKCLSSNMEDSETPMSFLGNYSG